MSYRLKDTRPLSAASDLTGKVGYVAKRTGVETCDLATDPFDDIPAGIIEVDGAAGDRVTLHRFGHIADEVVAGAAITAGTHLELTYDSNGKLVPATAPGQWVVAQADLSVNSSAEDDQISVFAVLPYRYAGRNEVPATGEATIASGDSDTTVSLGAAYANGWAIAQINQAAADAALTSIALVNIDGAGDLTITGNAAADADVNVGYIAHKPAS